MDNRSPSTGPRHAVSCVDRSKTADLLVQCMNESSNWLVTGEMNKYKDRSWRPVSFSIILPHPEFRTKTAEFRIVSFGNSAVLQFGKLI